MVETVTLQVDQERNAIKENTQGKKTKAEQTIFLKKDQKMGTEGKEVDTKTKVATNVKVGVKTLAKQGASTSKTTVKASASGAKISRPTIGQILLKHVGRKQEEARKGKTTVLTAKKLTKTDKKDSVKEGTAGKASTKSDQVKDQPQTNVTQTISKGVTIPVSTTFNKTRPGTETLEQSTLAEKNVTQSPGKKVIKKVKAESINATKVVQSADSTRSETSRTGSGRGKVVQKSQYMVNVTTAETTDKAKVLQTSVQSSGNATRRAGGSGLGSVKVENITSHSFTLTWSAPLGMFKNFTVSRREHRAEGEEEEEEEEAEEGAFVGDDKAAITAKNTTEVQAQSESTNGTVSSPKAPGSRGKAEGKRVSMVLPGGVRSVEFSNLQPRTRYAMHIFGTAPGKRSKIHRVTVTTGN